MPEIIGKLRLELLMQFLSVLERNLQAALRCFLVNNWEVTLSEVKMARSLLHVRPYWYLGASDVSKQGHFSGLDVSTVPRVRRLRVR